MLNNIKISVIIPVYNVEQYVQQCVESIACQENEQVEIIIVNDGSTDNSLEICKKMSEKYPNIKLVDRENSGASEARNYGFKCARGEYLLCVDSDDYIDKSSLSRIIESINKNPADVIFLNAKKVFPDGKNVDLGDCIRKEKLQYKSREEAIKHIATRPKYPASPCTKAVKRTLICDNNIFFEKGLFSEDIDWSVKVFLAARSFDFCEGDHYFYRQRPMSRSKTNYVKNLADLISIIEKWINAAETTEDSSSSDLIYSLMAYETPILLRMYYKRDTKFKAEYNGRMKNICRKLLPYRKEKKYQGINLIYKLFGIDIAAKSVYIYGKLK